MRLTKFSDFAFRVLILAASDTERTFTIEETAGFYGISAPHLKKVVRMLAKTGYLHATRGRSGGYRLARQAEEINLGEVLRTAEPEFGLVECFRPGNACGITDCCKLPTILEQALGGFLEVLDGHTLADILIEPRQWGNPTGT